MPATIASGLTNITLANNNTGFSVWKRDGTGGTPSAVSETDVFIQGTGACSVKVSNQGVVLAYGTGGTNLSAAGTHLYIWVNMLAGGLMATRANNGLCIFVSSDATLTTGANYKMWAVDGSDTYPGGWVRYVIDLSKTATFSAGTLNLASVQHVGMYCDTRPNVAKFDNLVIDRIDYTTGTGLRVYGTSTTDAMFQDIIDADEGTVGNKYGIVTTKGGIAYVRGRIILGDNVGTNASNLTNTDRVVVFENPVYYDGTSVVSCMANSFAGITVAGNGTNSTSVQFGKKVGTGDTARGRNGLYFVANAPQTFFNFNAGNATTVKMYGSTFRNFAGTLSWSNSPTHEFIGCTVDNCSQFDPVGGVIIRNSTFSGYAGTLAALKWNNNIDIKNSSFISNTDGTNNPAAIEHNTNTGSPYSYDGLTFSGNDFDVLYSAAASTGLLEINAVNGSNPGTTSYTITNATGNTVSIQSAVGISITALDSETNNPVVGASVYMKLVAGDGGTVVINGETNASGVLSGSYTGSTPVTLDTTVSEVRSGSGEKPYVPYTLGGIISSSGYTQTALLSED